MKTTLQANVRMVQKYDSETTKGINVFCEEENEGLNENLLGPVQLVMGGPLDLFGRFQEFFKSGYLPGALEMTVDVGRGAGGKAKLTVLAVRDPALNAHLNSVDRETGEINETHVSDKPAIDEPAIDEPVIDKPVIDKPVIDKPVIDKPVIDKPVLDKPVLDKPGKAGA